MFWNKPKTTESVVEIIEEIHNSFETASEKLLIEAKEIINSPTDKECELKKQLGFGSAKGVEENDKKLDEIRKNKSLLDELNELNQKYPQFKFISEQQVDEICQKYNLIMGQSSQYIGDIPNKNLLEIKHFLDNISIIKEEDYSYIKTDYFNPWGDRVLYRSSHSEFLHNQEHPSRHFSIYKDDKFKICAPIADMKIEKNQKIVGNRIVNIPDPVVLFPIKQNFYIIVSKWGIEGQDSSLTNEKMN